MVRKSHKLSILGELDFSDYTFDYTKYSSSELDRRKRKDFGGFEGKKRGKKGSFWIQSSAPSGAESA